MAEVNYLIVRAFLTSLLDGPEQGTMEERLTNYYHVNDFASSSLIKAGNILEDLFHRLGKPTLDELINEAPDWQVHEEDPDTPKWVPVLSELAYVYGKVAFGEELTWAGGVSNASNRFFTLCRGSKKYRAEPDNKGRVHVVEVK